MTQVAASIPYEKQEDNWKCGAACLAMAYRSFDLSCTQSEIWPSIQRPSGQRGAWTHCLAKDALRRGLSAQVLQARVPWDLLGACQRLGLRTILNVQLRRGGPQRHFALLLEVAKDHLRLHDPFFGPELRRDRAEFLELWGAGSGWSTSPGNILVVLGRRSRPQLTCRSCRRRLPKTLSCSVCCRVVDLALATALGCANPSCRRGRWSRIYCPECDGYLLPAPATLAERASVSERTKAMNPTNDLDKLSQAFEQYRTRITEIQRGAADGPAKEQLGQLFQQMNSQYATMIDEVKKHNEKLDEQIQQSLAKIREAQKRNEEQAAQRAQQPPRAIKRPKSKKDEPIDPELGAKLRNQLLEEFGNRPGPAGPIQGDIWQEMEREEKK